MQVAQPLHQPRAERRHAGEEGGVAHAPQHDLRRPADDRPAGESAAVIAGGERAGHAIGEQRRADGQPAAQSLCQGHHVRLHPKMLVRPELASAPHPALNLVEDQQRAVPVAQRAQRRQELRRGGVNTPLALHRLDKDGAGPRADQLLGGGAVVEGGEAHAGQQGAEGSLVFLAGGEGQRARRPPVKAAGESDQIGLAGAERLAGALTRELDRRFHRLGAGVAEVHLVGEGALAEHLGQVRVRGGVVEVADVAEPGHLLADSSDQLRVRMTERVDADARREVEIGFAVAVGEHRALPALQHKRRACVGIEHVLCGLFHSGARHRSSPSQHSGSPCEIQWFTSPPLGADAPRLPLSAGGEGAS